MHLVTPRTTSRLLLVAALLLTATADARHEDRRHPGNYPQGWSVKRSKARKVLQRFGYTKQATIFDPGGQAHYVLKQAWGIHPRVGERYVNSRGKQWVMTATGKGYAGPRQGRHEIKVQGPVNGLAGETQVRLDVGNLGLQTAPRRWDRPYVRKDSVPQLSATIKLPDGRKHHATLERVGKNGWRTPTHIHPSLGPRVSFEMDARGDVHNLTVQTPQGSFSQLSPGHR